MEDSDELKETYRLQCWYGIEADPRGVKQVMWLEILPEFSYKPPVYLVEL